MIVYRYCKEKIIIDVGHSKEYVKILKHVPFGNHFISHNLFLYCV